MLVAAPFAVVFVVAGCASGDAGSSVIEGPEGLSDDDVEAVIAFIRADQQRHGFER